MYRAKILNNIAEEGLLRLGQGYEYGNDIQNLEGTLVCSVAVHDLELSSELLAIAKADVGANSILVDKRSERGIVMFSTLGASADAVKELVITGLFLTSRKIAPALEWIRALKDEGGDVDKLVGGGKGQFAGPKVKSKSPSVIGFDVTDISVVNVAKNLGMEIYGYDPYPSVDAAWGLSCWVHHAGTLNEIFENCDYLTVHVPLTPDTKGLVNIDSITKIKDEVHTLSSARGELVDTASVLDGLKSDKIATYATDFPFDELIGVENVLVVPHLGASTPESEENCVRMAVDELKGFLENGNIRNSVNMSLIFMPRTHAVRIYVFYHDVRNTTNRFSSVTTNADIDIGNVQSKSRGDYAYTTLDMAGKVDGTIFEPMRQMEKIIHLRVTH